MGVVKYSTALLVSYLVIVLSLSIPVVQPIAGSDNHSAVDLPAGPSNLTAPQPIPGFEARLLFDRNPTLLSYEVYTNAIELMAALAELPYSMILGNIRMSGPGDISQVVISPWPEIAGQLQIKHAAQVLYEAGNAVAVIPETRQNYVPRLYAGLFFENRQIGFMKWQPIPTSIAGKANNALSPINATASTSALRLFHTDKPTGLRDDTGVLVDKNDSRFKVKYMLFDRPTSLRETFTAFLDAMAIAAPNEATDAGAFVNAVSVSGVVALNMHGTGYHSLLSWKLIVRTLLLLWEHGDFANEIDFEMAYDGIRIGEGFILNMPASRTSVASSR